MIKLSLLTSHNQWCRVREGLLAASPDDDKRRGRPSTKRKTQPRGPTIPLVLNGRLFRPGGEASFRTNLSRYGRVVHE